MKSMKKIIVALLVAIMGISAANAELRFGVKAGLNLNNLHLNELKAVSSVGGVKDYFSNNGTGFTVGVMGEYMTPLLGFGVDLSLMYTRMNADVDFVMGTETGTLKNSNFLEIPINLKYRFSLPVVGKYIAPYLFTGPDFAFKLGKQTFNDLKTRTCQVAWNLGLGLQFFNHLQISGSYAFGINNVVEKVAGNYVNPIGDVKAKNNYWTVTAAYLF